MKCCALTLFVILSCGEVAANTAYHTFCTNATATLASNATSDATFTNLVAIFIAETNGAARATARVVMAVALYDIFEKMTDDMALDLCVSICTNTIADADCPVAAWQKPVACAVLATALATRREYGESFNVCTNALAESFAEPSSSDDVMLWNELCAHQFVPGLDVHATLNFYSAMSLIFSGAPSLLSPYTNALPSVAHEKILEAVE